MALHRHQISVFRRSNLAALTLLAAAGGAKAQCDWSIQHVPDFDQRRQVTPSVPGLPGDGSMYCAPTSALNWVAYIANHGYPNTMLGPRYWQNNANYNLVTGRDTLMGMLMGTDPITGTGGSGWISGAQAYLDIFTPGKFSVSGDFADGGHCPGTFDLQFIHLLGGLTAISYGRYDEGPSGFFTRNGGHCISLVGMKDYCSTSPTKVLIRDPADDGTNTNQSTFATAQPPIHPVAAHFRGKVGLSYDSRTEFRFTTYSTPTFFDGLIVIWPTFGLTTGGSTDLPQTLHVLRPNWVDIGVPQPPTDFSTPTGGQILDVAIHPRMSAFLYITGAVGSTPAMVFTLDPLSGQSTPAGTFTNPRRFAVSRFAHLYVLDGQTIDQFDLNGPGAAGLPSTPSLDIDAMVYDDHTDKLVGLDVGRRTIEQWDPSLTGGALSLQFPPDPCLAGRVYLAISQADASLWVASLNCETLYKIVGGGAAGLSVSDMIQLPPGSHPTGLNVNTVGHVLFSNNGVLVEMEKDANGAWINSPSSDFAGSPAGAQFFLSKTRSNFDPATMVGPEWRNLPDPEIQPELPDCYANCDGSSTAPVLNINDFLCFQAQFAAGDPQANCDESTAAPVLNINDFLCFQSKFAAGCP